MVPHLGDESLVAMYDAMTGPNKVVDKIDYFARFSGREVKPFSIAQRASQIRSRVEQQPAFVKGIRSDLRDWNTPRYLPTVARAKQYHKVSDGIWGTAGAFPGTPRERNHGPLLIAPRVLDKPITLYHGTALKNRESIARDGLTAPGVRERANTSTPINQATWDREASDRVFMTPSRERAERYARRTAHDQDSTGLVVSTRLTGRELRDFGGIAYSGGTFEPEVALKHVPSDRLTFKRHDRPATSDDWVTHVGR